MRPEFAPYLWDGLDLKRYEPIRVIILNKKKRDYLIFMWCKDEGDHHWCIEYRGSGKYFTTFDDLLRYFRKRFKKQPEEIL